MEQQLLSGNLGFDMVIEDDNTIAVRRVYPANASADEILNGVNRTPQVTLQCFDPLLIDELYLIGKRISLQNHRLYDAAIKPRSFWSIIKNLFTKN
ncbi:hypothetical protein A3860_38830 [Niastella vici]|uniref:Uncharacterized protein n=1 Tax=Niastella vici TaxID=1703345 RepID=A0A1V9FLE8_9BACT|nr:hypothetical protein [Niastella vici]OQP59127.1 hypothetical protein A3860_38830 [Niastella vici]